MVSRGKMGGKGVTVGAAKEQIRLRLSAELLTELRGICRARDVSIGDVVQSILHERLLSGREPGTLRSLELSIAELRQAQRNLNDDIDRLAEAFAFYVYQWFCHTIPMPVSQRKAAALDGKRRYQNYVRILQKRLEAGSSFLSAMLETAASELGSGDQSPDERLADSE
jgi:hypothetical protein